MTIGLLRVAIKKIIRLGNARNFLLPVITCLLSLNAACKSGKVLISLKVRNEMIKGVTQKPTLSGYSGLYISLYCVYVSGFRPKQQLFGLSWDFDFLVPCWECRIFFEIRSIFLNAAYESEKVVLLFAYLKCFFAEHGKKCDFLGQGVEIFKCLLFMVFISHNCNQTTSQPKTWKVFGIHKIRTCTQFHLQL